MLLKASELCEMLDGELDGDGNVTVDKVSKIEEGSASSLSFLANPKYTHHLYSTQAGIVLVSKDFVPEKKVDTTLIKVKDPYSAFTLVLGKYFGHLQHKTGIEQPSFVSGTAKTGNELYLGAFAYLGEQVTVGNQVKIYPGTYVGDNVVIGNNTVIYAGVKIYAGCTVGSNCIIHSGTVIGADGFGFAPQKNGSYEKIPQTGNVVIEDNVEIGANCTIDRATMGSTVIRKGAKLDNLIQVAHNVEIGENTVIASQTGISGSTKLGKQIVVGGQVGFAGHLSIADGNQFGAQSGIPKSITESNKLWHGTPIVELKQALKSQVILRNLPELNQRLNDLEKNLKQLLEDSKK